MPPKLSAIYNLAPQSFSWYKVAPQLPIPYNLAPPLGRTVKMDGKAKKMSFWGFKITKIPSPVLNEEYKMPSRRHFACSGTNAREDELQTCWNQSP